MGWGCLASFPSSNYGGRKFWLCHCGTRGYVGGALIQLCSASDCAASVGLGDEDLDVELGEEHEDEDLGFLEEMDAFSCD